MAELSTLARPYARAAFEYAVAANDLQGWSDSLKVAASVAAQPAIISLLGSPNHTAAKQADAFIGVCGDQLGAKVQNFIRVLAENRRLPLLPQIAAQYEVFKANREKSVDVEITSASELDPAQQEKLAAALSAKLERKVNMQVVVDRSLLGGAVVRAGDTVIDGSIRGRLAKLAESLNV